MVDKRLAAVGFVGASIALCLGVVFFPATDIDAILAPATGGTVPVGSTPSIPTPRSTPPSPEQQPFQADRGAVSDACGFRTAFHCIGRACVFFMEGPKDDFAALGWAFDNPRVAGSLLTTWMTGGRYKAVRCSPPGATLERWGGAGDGNGQHHPTRSGWEARCTVAWDGWDVTQAAKVEAMDSAMAFCNTLVDGSPFSLSTETVPVPVAAREIQVGSIIEAEDVELFLVPREMGGEGRSLDSVVGRETGVRMVPGQLVYDMWLRPRDE